jgi:glutamate racemase
MASSWVFEKRKLPLRVNWSISRGSLAEKENGFVLFKDDGLEGRGEVAFLTHGSTSIDDIEEAFLKFKEEAPSYINGLDDLTALLSSMELPSALRFAIESSYVHYLSQVMDSTKQRVLGVREVSKIQTSFSIPLMPSENVEGYIKNNSLSRFHSLKIKVADFDDYKFVLRVCDLFSGKIRIDGNECFSEAKEVLAFLEPLSHIPLEFVEQPLASSKHEEAIRLRERSKVMLMADESVQDGPIIDDFQKMFHGVNIKLMKAGGYIKAMNQLREARALGLKTMLGCMVETSVGISSAMNIAHGVDFFDLDGFLLLKEDPFKLVYEDKGTLYYSHNH